jgi:hypothetical protein
MIMPLPLLMVALLGCGDDTQPLAADGQLPDATPGDARRDAPVDAG